MKCREAVDLLSPYLDGELPAVEAADLEYHLKTCVTCREEMEALRRISEALRAEADTVQAPPEFAAGVMAALEPRRVPWYTRLPGVWKQAVAAAAALALIAAGSLHMGLGQLFTRAGVQVAEGPSGPQVVAPGPATQSDPGVNAPGPGKAAEPNNAKPNYNEPVTPSGGNDEPDGTGTPEKETPASTAPTVRTAGTEAPAIASNYEERVFLSKQRAIRSTLLKLQVDNVPAALNKALSLGGTYGARFQPAQQIGNGEIEVVRLTVGREQAEVLIGKLAALGTVVTRDTTVQDITGQFDRTREQYQALLAQRNAVKDSGGLAEIEANLRSLENQLTEWDREAEQYVIVLWLQSM